MPEPVGRPLRIQADTVGEDAPDGTTGIAARKRDELLASTTMRAASSSALGLPRTTLTCVSSSIDQAYGDNPRRRDTHPTDG